MTKSEIVNKISEETGIDKADVMKIIDTLTLTIKDTLAEGENVYLRGFGSFILRKRAKKTGRNITKNTTIIIPEHIIPAFKPAKIFLEAIKETKVISETDDTGPRSK